MLIIKKITISRKPRGKGYKNHAFICYKGLRSIYDCFSTMHTSKIDLNNWKNFYKFTGNERPIKFSYLLAIKKKETKNFWEKV